MRTLIISILISCTPRSAAPPPRETQVVIPEGCGAQCDSDVQCGQDLLRTCRICNFGQCKSTRPDSQRVDAGVGDAKP
jgi:hypothetical protein